jgi:hypothetical protein
MMHRCRVCGICAGGLVRDRYGPDEVNWPEPDLCPTCPADAEAETYPQFKALIEAARQQVAPIIEKERAGEHITAEIMEMRLK